MPRSLLALVCMLVAGPVAAMPQLDWQDDFTATEKRMLTAWVEHAHCGLEDLFGELPGGYRVHMRRMPGRGEPVPWANTDKRYGQRSVRFYVDPGYPARDFERDWTATHELSHLLFPYLGRDGMWFAEGIASYLQYQAMYANGTLAWNEVMDRYAERFERAAGMERVDDIPIAELPRIVRQTQSQVRLYWGGAAYFLEVDRRLYARHGLRLNEVIRDYLDCCASQGSTDASAIIGTFDRLSDSRVFADTYHDTVARPGFPETGAGLTWLRHNPPALTQHCSSGRVEDR